MSKTIDWQATEKATDKKNTENNGQETAEKNMYSHAPARQPTGEITHKPNGQFAPGNKLGGRRKKDRGAEKALVAALHQVLPPERVIELLEQCIEWGYSYNSSRILMEVIRFHYSYTLGTPVQRSITASTKLETLMERVAGLSDDEFDALEAELKDG